MNRDPELPRRASSSGSHWSQGSAAPFRLSFPLNIPPGSRVGDEPVGCCKRLNYLLMVVFPDLSAQDRIAMKAVPLSSFGRPAGRPFPAAWRVPRNKWLAGRNIPLN
jgi:hypothetical protein